MLLSIPFSSTVITLFILISAVSLIPYTDITISRAKKLPFFSSNFAVFLFWYPLQCMPLHKLKTNKQTNKQKNKLYMFSCASIISTFEYKWPPGVLIGMNTVPYIFHFATSNTFIFCINLLKHICFLFICDPFKVCVLAMLLCSLTYIISHNYWSINSLYMLCKQD